MRYASRSHAAALDQILYAINRREALVIVTGEVGTGKTLLARTVFEHLDRRTFVSVISDPLLTATELLKQVLSDFGVLSGGVQRTHEPSNHDLVQTLQQFLTSLLPLQAHAVVIIDEAQHLQPETLEQIRLLSNFETDTTKLLQIILFGQPELELMLQRPEMRQLEQRISRRHELQPLGESEVRHYIDCRLSVAQDAAHDAAPVNVWEAAGTAAAGGDSTSRGPSARVSFSPDAIKKIAALSKGVPRVVNILCDRALELGCARQLRVIDEAVVTAAAGALKLPARRTVRVPHLRAAAAAAAILVVVSSPFWWPSRSPAVPTTPASASDTSAAPPARAAATSSAAAAPAAVPPTPVTAPAAPAPVAAPPSAGARDTSTVNLAPSETFTVLVASFRSSRRAEEIAGQAKQLGLPAYTRVGTAGWYQVAVGPYASRSQALSAQERLEDAAIRDSVVAPSTRR